MTTSESEHRDAPHPPVGTGGFVDSHGFFGLVLMSMFVVAMALAIVGLTSPSWLGFS